MASRRRQEQNDLPPEYQITGQRIPAVPSVYGGDRRAAGRQVHDQEDAMAIVEADISMSVDGFVSGPNTDKYPGLGEGGEILHAG